jgi:branched-chain amino acid aminotransferase
MLIHVNGELVPSGRASVSVFDHGFLYGDGVFEGIRVYDGLLFRLREHVERLFQSARSLALGIPLTVDEIMDAVVRTVAANDRRDGYVRLVVSRGTGDLGLDPKNCLVPTMVIICDAIALYPPAAYENGIALATAGVRRVPLESLDPRVKSLNYLNNLLAKLQARNAGCPEALMLNHQGLVAEGSADNIFIVRAGRLLTPDPLQGALEGITRQAVLDMAATAGIPAAETVIALHDVYNADECFLTGTAAEIVPVTKVDGRLIADGRPGPITRRLMADFRVLRMTDGVRVTYAPAAPSRSKVPETVLV